MCFRLYFVIRCFMNYTCIYSGAYSKYLCWSYGFASDTRFSIKCYIKKDPFKSILMLLFGTIFTLAYVLRIFELPNFSKDADSKSGLQVYVNSVWCIVVTLTTVGYGDISPSTQLGRFVAMVAALWGAFLISIIVYCTTTAFSNSHEQDLALSQIRLSEKAATTLQKTFKVFLAKKKYVKEL